MSDALHRAVAALMDRKGALDAMRHRHDAEEKKLKAEIAKIETAILDHMNTSKLESFRTDRATVYRTVQRYPNVKDWDAFGAFVLASGDLSWLQRRVSKSAVEEYGRETGTTPPGVEIESAYVLNTRKPS